MVDHYPACCGNCRQGRDRCATPAACLLPEEDAPSWPERLLRGLIATLAFFAVAAALAIVLH